MATRRRCRTSPRTAPVHDVPNTPVAKPRPGLVSPDTAFALGCLVLGGVRYSMLVAGGAPPGIDAGNWLDIGRSLFGDDAGLVAPAYPPVAPALVAGAVAVAGALHGVAFVAALASLAPAIGAYVVLRRNGLRWPAVGLAVLLVPLAATGEATAWGGYPQLLATGLGVVTLSMLDGHLRSPGRRGALAAGAALAAVLATSHFVGAIVLAGAVVLLLLHRSPSLVRSGGAAGVSARASRRHLALVALPSLVLVPLYVAMATSMGAGYGSRPAGVRVTLSSLLADLEFVYREAPLVWRPLVALAVLTPLLAGPLRRRPSWAVATSLVVAVAVVLVGTGEPRALYLLPVAAVASAGFWTEAWSTGGARPGRAATAVLAAGFVAVLGVVSLRGLDLFSAQRSFYQVLAPGVVEGIDWLRANSTRGDLVAVASVDGAPLGWWVEGLGRRSVLSGSALHWLYLEGERDRARTANRVFGPRFPDAAALDEARGAGVDYLLVARSADAYRHERVEAFRRTDAGSFVFENDDVVILAVASR